MTTTSQLESWMKTKKTLSNQQDFILKRGKFLMKVLHGFTYEDMKNSTGLEYHIISARVNELVKKGLLRNSGKRHYVSRTKRYQTVWEIA